MASAGEAGANSSPSSMIVPLSRVYDDLPGVTPIATEFLIESASGGSCVLRVVTSAYGRGADWENEFFTEMIAGVIAYLDNLAVHLDRSDAAIDDRAGRTR